VLTRRRPSGCRPPAGSRAMATAVATAVWSVVPGALAPVALAGPGHPAAHRASGFSRAAGTQLVRDLRDAWQISRGQGVTIALISSGVDASAPGLAGKVTRGPAFGPVPSETIAPGTVLASVMVGSGPNGGNPTGTLGLAPGARILALRINERTRSSTGWQRDVGLAINYAVAHGAKVIYVDGINPVGGTTLDAAVQHAESRNVVVICEEYRPRGYSAGSAMYPDDLPGVLGAASVVVPGLTQPPPRKGPPSPANAAVVVSAPANVLNATGPAGAGYFVFNDYSAVAWLTATVAIIKSVYPSLPPAQVAGALALSARDHPPSGYTSKLGFGMINPIGALREAAKLRSVPAVAAAGPGVADPSARFLPGPAPGAVVAVRHSRVKLAIYGGAVLAGLILLLAAVLVWHRRRRGPVTPVVTGP
jgi:Subtilase family